MPYGGLIDSSTHIVLDIDTFGAALIYVNKVMQDTYYIPAMFYPNYVNDFPLFSVDASTYPEWTWKPGTRLLEKTRPDLITDKIRSKSLLATAKRQAISTMMFDLSNARFQTGTGVAFEETVYVNKRLQAQAFKASGYDLDTILAYPFVSQYANFLGVSLKQAADDILFAARLDEEILARTELIRLTYFKRIAEATRPEDMSLIIKDFVKEMYWTALA